MTIEANVEVGIGDFLTFADYFFDGLLADWAVLNKIAKSKSQAESTRRKINLMQYKLDDLWRSVERERDLLTAEVDALVLEAQG